MESLILTWLAAVLFVLMIFWGTNVPAVGRSFVVYGVLIALLVFNLIAQAYLFNNRTPMGSGPAARLAADQAILGFDNFLAHSALVSGSLRRGEPVNWYRIISSTLLHYGWLHLLFNAWFFVLFGHVLERILGACKMLVIVAAGLIIPAALDGWLPLFTGQGGRCTGGFSGVVYAVMGAYLVCFPRSRCYGAFTYDLRYWGTVLVVLLPVTMLTRYAGPALTEMVILLGMLGAYIMIQPEHIRLSAPAAVVMLGKLGQDLALIEPLTGEVISNSFWRIGGGFFVGIVAGFLFNRSTGWKLTWDDETKAEAPTRRSSGRTSVAELEIAGHKTLEGARIFLGQRVFVGDASRAATFYRDVVMVKFPNLILPSQEQMALARLLHFKGFELEAMHAYENILLTDPLPEENWIAFLKAAEYIVKLAPDRVADARRYLDKFDEGPHNLMRDRIEAERLRAELPVVESDCLSLVTAHDPVLIQDVEAVENFRDALDTRGNIANDNTHSQVRTRCKPPAPLDFPKLTPRTFRYVAGAETISTGLTITKGSVARPPVGDSFESYWKPLPCLSEKMPLPSILDRPVKNPRVIAEDSNRASRYGVTTGLRGARAGGGRLSRLEVIRKDARVSMPKRGEEAGKYGGLDEHIKMEKNAQPKLRLRGEKEPLARLESRRSKARNDKAGTEREFAKQPLVPGDHMPEDREGYGIQS